MSVTIEALPDDSPPEVIELALNDPLSERAASTLEDNDSVRFVREPAPSAPMTIVVGDARDERSVPALIARRRPTALAIAVVAVTRTSDVAFLTRHFDAVLPVVVNGDAAAALARGLAAVTMFATAEVVRLPVDETYPLFARAGLLRHAEGTGMTIEAATRDAMTKLGVPKIERLLLHIETTEGKLGRDADAATILLGRLLPPEFAILVSYRPDGLKRLSLLAMMGQPRP